jgi:hypothetical protein
VLRWHATVATTSHKSLWATPHQVGKPALMVNGFACGAGCGDGALLHESLCSPPLVVFLKLRLLAADTIYYY